MSNLGAPGSAKRIPPVENGGFVMQKPSFVWGGKKEAETPSAAVSAKDRREAATAATLKPTSTTKMVKGAAVELSEEEKQAEKAVGASLSWSVAKKPSASTTSSTPSTFKFTATPTFQFKAPTSSKKTFDFTPKKVVVEEKKPEAAQFSFGKPVAPVGGAKNPFGSFGSFPPKNSSFGSFGSFGAKAAVEETKKTTAPLVAEDAKVVGSPSFAFNSPFSVGSAKADASGPSAFATASKAGAGIASSKEEMENFGTKGDGQKVVAKAAGEVDTSTGEEDETTVWSVKAKVFALLPPPKPKGIGEDVEKKPEAVSEKVPLSWRERGLGMLKLNIKGTMDAPETARIVMRAEQTGRVRVNRAILKGMTVTLVGEKVLRMTMVDEDGGLEINSVKVGKIADRDELAAKIKVLAEKLPEVVEA